MQEEKIASLDEKIGDLNSKEMFEQFKTEVMGKLEEEVARITEQEERMTRQDAKILEQGETIANQEARIATQEEKSVEQDLKISRQTGMIVKLEETIAEQQKAIEEQKETIQMIAIHPHLRGLLKDFKTGAISHEILSKPTSFSVVNDHWSFKR